MTGCKSRVTSHVSENHKKAFRQRTLAIMTDKNTKTISTIT